MCGKVAPGSHSGRTRVAGLQVCRVAPGSHPGCRISGVQGCRIGDLHACKAAKIYRPSFKIIENIFCDDRRIDGAALSENSKAENS